MPETLKSYLAGAWVEGAGDGSPLVDPVSGAVLATASSTGLDLAAALSHARAVGGPALRALSFGERAGLLKAAADVLTAKRDDYFEIARRNSGNTKVDAAIDIDGGIGTLRYYARIGAGLGGAHHLVDGDLQRLSKEEGYQALHLLLPRQGAAIHINAFNFPSWGLWEKAAVALLAGVPVLAKPATPTAWLAQRMVADVVAAGVLPEGALSILCGSAGDLLDQVAPEDMIAFTGSADTGATIAAHPRVRALNLPVNIEADSLNAAVLGPDAGDDLQAAFVAEVAREMTVKAGQKCTAIRRAFVPAALADRVAEALAARLAKTVVGDPADESVRMGPVVSAAQRDGVLAGIDRLRREASVVFDGGPGFAPKAAAPEKGAFVPPTLLRADPASAAAVHEHEVFGPVSTLLPYADEAALFPAVRRGGGSLVASVFSDDGDFLTRAWQALGDRHGRLMMVDSATTRAHTGHGIVMPMCLHGGPGRAGGGEELGGLRGLALYQQRTAVQGPTPWLERLKADGAPFAG